MHNEWYQLTVSSMHLFFCRCSSTLLSRPDCFFSCSLVTQGNKPGKFIHSSLLDGPPLSSVNTFPHFFYRFITTFLTSTNEMVRQGYWSNDVCGLTCIECHSVKCVYTYMYIYIYTHRVSPSGISYLCSTVAGMVTPKGSMSTEGDTPSFCPTLQVLDMFTLGDAANVNPVIEFLPHTLQHLAVDSSDCLHDPLSQL